VIDMNIHTPSLTTISEMVELLVAQISLLFYFCGLLTFVIYPDVNYTSIPRARSDNNLDYALPLKSDIQHNLHTATAIM
jgi:hypothetical protein